MTPDDWMDAVSSRKASESNTFLGWFGLTSIRSTAISLVVSSVPGVDDRSAPSPRPRPRWLFMLQHLPREFEIGDSAAGAEIVQHDRLAVARRFAEPNVAWNHCLENFAWEVTTDLVAHLKRETCPTIEHREHDPLDRQPCV